MWIPWHQIKLENENYQPNKDFICTNQTARLQFLLEGLLVQKFNTVIVGESGTGKSWLLKYVLNQQLQKFINNALLANVILYHYSDTE
jgi:type IV secretory pathway VirB4 component